VFNKKKPSEILKLLRDDLDSFLEKRKVAVVNAVKEKVRLLE